MGGLASLDATPAAERGLFDGRPEAIVDLDTRDGLQLIRGEWRYEEAAAGAPVQKVGAVDFDDAQWEIVPAGALQQRRTNGGPTFAWYRLSFTMPARVGSFDTAGATVAFEIVVDDYAEVWVHGQLPRMLGQPGGALVAGFNAPNRVVVTRDAVPGQEVRIAVFAANGPLSDPPSNRIWIRSATLDFYQAPAPGGTTLDVTRADAALDAVVPPGTRLEKLAGGFSFVEGPVWVAGRGRAALQRPQRQPHLPLVAGPRRVGVPHQERLHRRRHRRVPPARLERPHARCGRAAHHRRTRQPPHHPAREERRPHGARRSLRRQTAEQPERSRLSIGRLALLQRSRTSACRSSSRIGAPSSPTPASIVWRRMGACRCSPPS